MREILTTLYHDRPDGLSGNEDVGQMSAWYVPVSYTHLDVYKRQLHDSATGRVAVYYGCADTVTGLAFGYIPEIIDFTRKNNITALSVRVTALRLL